MEKIVEPFDEFKFSALSKSKLINPFVKNVTIGPNRSLTEEEEEDEHSNNIDVNPKLSMHSTIELCHPHRNDGFNLIIHQMHNELKKKTQNKVNEAISKRINCFKKFSEKQELETKQRILLQQQMLINKVHQQELQIVNALEQHDRDASAQHEELVQYYKELADKKKRNDLELQEKAHQRQQINLILEKITADQAEFRSVYQDISNTLKSCKYLSHLKVALGDIIKHFKEMPERMDQIVARCKNGDVNEKDCQTTTKLIQDIKELLGVVKEKVKEVNEVESKPSIVPKTVPSTPLVSQPSSTTQQIASEILPSIPQPTVEVEKYVSKSSFKIYSELQSFMKSFESSLTELTTNQSFKQFCFQCKKAVNIPINAISAVSRSHLLDKYNRLSNLLNGQAVEVSGQTVCAAKHPRGIAYCEDLLARSFVLQGDLMISGKPEAAFAYSAVIISLWNEHPNFGKLLMAHFHEQCIYLVPMYKPRIVDQTDEEFYRSQGYRYTDGVVEKQDKFLKRMTGIMKLYAAILVTNPTQGQSKHPHGLSEGWRWLAAFVNLEPKHDITATMLYVFLETVGSKLEAAYGKAFQKLIVYICNVYLPIIKKIDSGGPVTRLELLLQNYLKEGRFLAPSGMLSNDFW